MPGFQSGQPSPVGRLTLTLVVVALLTACLPRASSDGQQAGGATLQPAASAQGAMTLKFSHVVAKSTPKGKAAEKFGELVREKSGGKIDVQVFANSELYRDADEIEALQQGSIQFIAPGNGKFGAVAPMWDALGLPYLLTSDGAINKLMDSDHPVARELFESMRPNGLLGLAIWANGWKHFINNKKPLRTPGDFQALRIGMTNKPDEA